MEVKEITSGGKLSHHAFLIEGVFLPMMETLKKELARILTITFKQSPDIWIEEYPQLGILDARRIRERAQTTGFGETKLFILGIGTATPEAQNALLKILEEPEEGTFFFFITENIGEIFPTLRSRLQLVRIGGAVLGAGAKEFLASGMRERFSRIEKYTGKHTTLEKKEMRAELLRFTNSLEDAFCRSKENIKKYPDVCRGLIRARKDITLPAASFRLILEHLALTLPRES